MKKESTRSVQLLGGSYVYAVLLVISFFATQAMRHPISAVLFWFLLLLPIVSIVTAKIGCSAIQVYVSSEAARVEKDQKVGYEIRIINNAPFPYPFVEAYITQPRDDGIRCLKRKMYLSLAPFGGYIINKEISFRYRGLYEIGVSDFYITDMLRLVRLRVVVDNYSNVLVFPRMLDVSSEDHHAYTEMPSVHAPTATVEMAEAANIREYRWGDSQKTIHWKLSSKTEELQVKDFSINRDRNVYIFADLAAATPCPEIKKRDSIQQMKKTLKLKEKKKIRLKDVAAVTAMDKAEKLTLRFKNLFKKKPKKEKRRKIVGDESTMETIEAIDRLISDTAFASAKRRKEFKQKQKKEKNAERLELKAQIMEQMAAEEAAEKAIIDKLYESITELTGDDNNIRIDDAVLSWGGKVKDEYEDDMAEFCTDGIVEIALSSVKRELSRGNKCTLVWYDSREDRGFSYFNIASPVELEAAFNRFASSATVEYDKKITDLIRVVAESMNVTIKFVTSNIDPVSLSEYCAVPAMFGGAGAGCTCEVMLFNPESRYVNASARREYGATCKERLIGCGIYTTEFKYIKNNDGSTTLVAVDF
ncbi:MAG: DUF58 domain-containing protein [Clostridia bacterium]|nr:DUF58 domain-containing protein [Clostridia bacterium]